MEITSPGDKDGAGHAFEIMPGVAVLKCVLTKCEGDDYYAAGIDMLPMGAEIRAATFAAKELAHVAGGSSSKSIGSLESLILSANKDFNNSGLSVAARSWEKHAGRPGGTFETLTGGIEQKNAAARRFVEEVLTNPGTTRTEISRGGVEYRLPSGQGVRYNSDGSLSGFLDPKN
jgi:hypothetical protein